ncbi:MAG: NodT family RND efflux system outer membrane lipoprotein [Puniceicoccaceae bacterium 5H]|nr:MAG: NodT family RND efflux system outer membrane lipoprotein [Puniceicoccaceae bacterium 5H]
MSTRSTVSGSTLAVCLLLGLGGCYHASDFHAERPPVEVPESFQAVAQETVPPQQWADLWQEPELATLLQDTFSRNPSWQQAWAQLEVSLAQARQAGAGRLPQVQATGQIQRSKQPIMGATSALAAGGGQQQSGQGGNTRTPDAYTDTTYRAGLAASWELDLWGKLAAQDAAAERRVAAGRAQIEGLAISLAARVTETYLRLRTAEARLALLHRQYEAVQEQIALLERRVGQGQSSALDLSQQEQTAERLQGQVQLAQSQRDQYAHQLATLTGHAPQNWQLDVADRLPPLPPLPEPGLPIELLQQRPDLQQAFYEFQAVDAEAAAAAREHLPSITLSAEAFLQATELDELLDTVFWSIAGEAQQTIFDGGRIEAQEDVARAQADVARLSYAQAWLDALREVADALSQARELDAYEQSVRTQLSQSEQALELARSRFVNGAVGYLRVLDAEQQLREAQIAELEARRDRWLNRLQLYRAVASGGDDLPAAARQATQDLSAS